MFIIYECKKKKLGSYVTKKKNKYIGNQIIDRTFRCMLAPNETGEEIRGSLPQTFFLLI